MGLESCTDAPFLALRHEWRWEYELWSGWAWSYIPEVSSRASSSIRGRAPVRQLLHMSEVPVSATGLEAVKSLRRLMQKTRPTLLRYLFRSLVHNKLGALVLRGLYRRVSTPKPHERRLTKIGLILDSLRMKLQNPLFTNTDQVAKLRREAGIRS
jgi:hypothetical protein